VVLETNAGTRGHVVRWRQNMEFGMVSWIVRVVDEMTLFWKDVWMNESSFYVLKVSSCSFKFLNLN
jgi:hypothetical protein